MFRRCVSLPFVLFFLCSFQACGGGGGDGDDRPNPYNGTWRSEVSITRDNCNRSSFFPSFAPNIVYSITGDTFDLDVYDSTNDIMFFGEMFESSGMGASATLLLSCGQNAAIEIRKSLRSSLISSDIATIDLATSFQCPGGPTCNINASGRMIRSGN